ncbi:MAG: hypothetical protein WD317_00965 [Balneolaceae bacterium]
MKNTSSGFLFLIMNYVRQIKKVFTGDGCSSSRRIKHAADRELTDRTHPCLPAWR